MKKVNATTTAPIVTMVWSGGSQWTSSSAQIVALASALPAAYGQFNPWGVVPQPVLPSQVQSLPGKGRVILSIGGSNASGWTDMAATPVSTWVTYFQNLFTSSGLSGLDFDLEGIDSGSAQTVYNFVGQLATQLKALKYLVTFTILQSTNVGFPPAFFWTTYASACDYVVLMLYDIAMYVPDGTGTLSYCDYAANTLAALTALVPSLKSKFIYALYPYPANNGPSGPITRPCCGPCVQAVIDKIRAGNGVGIALWCYGGYLGACSQTTGNGVVEAWVRLLNSGGGSGVQDFVNAYPGCSGQTDTIGNGCGYYYGCDSTNTCVPSSTGTIPDVNCNGSCTSAPQKWNCDSTQGTCVLKGLTGYDLQSTCNANCSKVVQSGNWNCDTTLKQCTQNGTTGYATQDACNTATSCTGPATTLMYSCNNGACSPDINGTLTQTECGTTCPVKYNCFSGYCLPGYPGVYTSLSTCQSACGTPTFYSCNGTTCQPDIQGYFTAPDCQGACVSAGATSTAACSTLGSQGACVGSDNASASQFTCNGETRCCCNDYVPSPTATNPTSCVAPSQPTQTLYNCNADTGNCDPSTDGTGFPQSSCKDSCKMQLYNCVQGTCQPSTNGSGQSKAQCQPACPSTPTPVQPSNGLYNCPVPSKTQVRKQVRAQKHKPCTVM